MMTRETGQASVTYQRRPLLSSPVTALEIVYLQPLRVRAPTSLGPPCRNVSWLALEKQVPLIFAAFAVTVRVANYAIYCAAIAAAVLIGMDLPHLGIGVLVMFLADLLQKRTAKAAPQTPAHEGRRVSGPGSRSVEARHAAQLRHARRS
jgi:hypothetical protein